MLGPGEWVDLTFPSRLVRLNSSLLSLSSGFSSLSELDLLDSSSSSELLLSADEESEEDRWLLGAAADALALLPPLLTSGAVGATAGSRAVRGGGSG